SLRQRTRSPPRCPLFPYTTLFRSVMAGAYVRGLQGDGPDGYLKAAATAKHYALNNVETDRFGISSNVDERALREYYLAHFQRLRSEEHTSELQSLAYLVCRLLLEK